MTARKVILSDLKQQPGEDLLVLVESKPYSSGVVLLTYRPAPDDDKTDD